MGFDNPESSVIVFVLGVIPSGVQWYCTRVGPLVKTRALRDDSFEMASANRWRLLAMCYRDAFGCSASAISFSTASFFSFGSFGFSFSS